MAPKKRKTDAVRQAMADAEGELAEREAGLDQREETLRLAIEGLDNEKRLMAGCTPSDVLHLNIGGTPCTVLHCGRTLRAGGRWWCI